MALHPRRGNVTVSTSYLDCNDDETDITVECRVTPGEREVRYQRNGDPGWPGTAAEVEIVSAEGEDGNDYREAIESDARWFDEVSDKAIEALGDAEESAREDAAEARAEARREARMLGEDY